MSLAMQTESMEPMCAISADINIPVRQVKKYRAVRIYRIEYWTKCSKPHVFECIIILCVLLVPCRLHATSIAIYRSEKMLAIAIDSAFAAIGSNGQHLTTACKINRVGDTAFAIAGLNGDRYLDLVQSAKSAIAGGGSLTEIADRFQSQTISAYKQMLCRFRQLNPTAFNTFCENKRGLEIVFLGLDQGIPAVIVVSYLSRTRKKEIIIEPSRVSCPGTCQNRTLATFISLGANSEIDRTVRDDPLFVVKHGLIEGLEMLIDSQIRATKDGTVAPPVTVFVMSRDRTFFAKSGVCE
jgi:hypothetical protein